MPQEVPLTVSVPVLVVMQLEVKKMPRAEYVPFVAMPVIVTLPEDVDEI